MAQITVWMNYVIFFREQSEYEFAISVAGSNLLELSPRNAANLFGIPYPYPTGDMDSMPKGIYFINPFTPGAQFLFPGPTGFFVDDSIEARLIAGQAGNPASIWPPGPDGLHKWSGSIVRSQGAGSSVSPPIKPMAQRRWGMGFEWTTQFEGTTNPQQVNLSRDASRTIDGKGLVIRGTNYPNPTNMLINAYRTGLVSPNSWERFYIRIRRLPTVQDVGFWRCHGTVASASGFGLKVTTAGTIRGFSIDSVSVQTDNGVVFTPDPNRWYRIDALLKFGSAGGTQGVISIYIDGIFAYSFIDTTGIGMKGVPNHASSDMGIWTGVDNECEVDIDDWIDADLPIHINPSTLAPLTTDPNDIAIDWKLGSHVRAHYSDSASLVGWAPNAYGVLNQGHNPFAQQSSQLVSTTSGATMEGLTDALPQSVPDSIANVLGAIAASIGLYSNNANATDGQLGYKVGLGAPVLVTINQLGTDVIRSVAYQPAGLVLPSEISPWSVVHTKSPDAFADTTSALVSTVEYLGVWGPEDDPIFEYPISRLTFIHNCNYANTQYGYVGSAPSLPVFTKGGTYVGNSLTQTIPLPGPCHFLWIREIASGSLFGGPRWFSPSLGATNAGNRVATPQIRVWSDINGNFKFSVTGASIDYNLAGRTYQYIAFCDPGMRFNLTGVFNHGVASSTPKVNPLINEDFTPESGFVQFNYTDLLPGGDGLFFKGPGIEANKSSLLNGNAIKTNFMNFGTGFFNSLVDSHLQNANTVYSFWRSADGGGCAGTMVQLLSYIGNGAGSRVIPLTPTSGRFPIFVLVVPNITGPSYFRDPSHIGSDSTVAGNNSINTTAITAVGLDQITVGASINANGVTYSIFALCGDTTGMNNGTFFNPICEEPSGGPYEDALPPDADVLIVGNGGLILGGAAPLTLLLNVSGIYTLIKEKRNDTLIDRQTGQTSIDVEIPDPTFKTGYIGG